MEEDPSLRNSETTITNCIRLFTISFEQWAATTGEFRQDNNMALNRNRLLKPVKKLRKLIHKIDSQPTTTYLFDALDEFASKEDVWLFRVPSAAFRPSPFRRDLESM
jgi:hypothetical protein